MVSTKTVPPTSSSSRRTSLEPGSLSSLEERAQALLSFLAGAQARRDPGRLVGFRMLAHQLLRLSRRLRSRGQELLDDAFDGAVEVVGHLAHQPDPKRRLRIEALAREEVAPGGGA